MTSLYNSIGGSRKTTSSAYANINGSRKQIFPYSATTIYTWNRYYTETEYSTTYTLWSTDYDIYYPMEDKDANSKTTVYYGTSYSKSGSVISLSGVKSFRKSGSYSLPVGTYYWLEGYGYAFGETTSIDISIENGSHDQCTLYYCDFSDEYVQQRVFQRRETEETVRGELRDQVTSTSKSTYPTNGISGSYWYEFVS